MTRRKTTRAPKATSRTNREAEGGQAELEFAHGHGGARPGAGRPKVKGSGVPHVTRERLAKSYPVFVTMPVVKGLPRLRSKAQRRVIERAMNRGRERFGFRLTQYSIQNDHLHLIAEARDRRALSRGMQGLTVRIAKGLNKLWARRGKVFRDRYHDRILRTPSEVRNALRYVLQNFRGHGVRLRPGHVDGNSSARWFDGWRGEEPLPRGPTCQVARARTWLQTVGWRRRGLLDVGEGPVPVGTSRARGPASRAAAGS